MDGHSREVIGMESALSRRIQTGSLVQPERSAGLDLRMGTEPSPHQGSPTSVNNAPHHITDSILTARAHRHKALKAR
jgi:hypothetical protein